MGPRRRQGPRCKDKYPEAEWLPQGPTSRVMLPSTPPLPSRDQECAKSPTGLCQVGLYIGSVCNREGCSIFAASSPPIVWGGEKVFLRQSTGTINKVVTLPLSDLVCLLAQADRAHLDGVELEARLEHAHRSREGTLLSEQLEQRIPDEVGRVRRKPMVL